MQGVEDACRVKTGCSSEGCRQGRDKMSIVGPSQMIFPLQVGLGDLKVLQRHMGTFVAE